jgi:hypothetical protein
MSITIYPHLKWELKIASEKELYKLIRKVEQYFNLDITFWTKNFFIKNDHEFWNAALSVETDDTDYVYIFRYNYQQNILYGCPVQTPDYMCLHYFTNPSLFNIFQEGIMKIIENGTLIENFY